jgi:hypothetical protein
MGKMKAIHLEYVNEIEATMDKITAEHGRVLSVSDYIDFLLDVYEQDFLQDFEANIVEYADELAWKREQEEMNKTKRPYTIDIDFEGCLLLKFDNTEDIDVYFAFIDAINNARENGRYIDHWKQYGRDVHYLMIEKEPNVLYLDEMESCSPDVLIELSKAAKE